MITGIGVDIIEIQRVRTLYERWGETFINKILTKEEKDYCLSKKKYAQHIAARFAAKEAFAKAIATGWSGIFNWKDVEVFNDASGKPAIELHRKLQSLVTGCTIFLSISHSENTVVALVIIEKNCR